MKKMEEKYMSLNDKARIYFRWSCMALLGGTPVEADTLLRENKSIIMEIAGIFLKSIDYIPSEIYRGVVVEKEIEELTLHEGFTYLSFSDDIKIAEQFADITDDMAFMIRLTRPELKYGYIIKYTPKPDEILFHHKFLDILPYQRIFASAGYGDNALKEQKEIMILQPEQPFTNIYKYQNEYSNL